jgi:hypothetical protein
MEGKLWKATWKRNGTKFVLSLVEHPGVTVTSATLDEAVEEFEDLVAEKLGDAVPHFEFIEPLPTAEESYVHILTGHKCAESITNLNQLFVRGRCNACGNLSGPRTEEMIELDSAPDGDLTFTDFQGQIISARLAEFLGIGKLDEIVVRSVKLRGTQSTDFFELRSRHPREYVAKRGLPKPRWAFKCKSCGLVVWMYMPHEATFSEFISREVLPETSVSTFPIGVDDRMRLAVDKETRAQVVRSKQFKNVVSKKLGILNAEDAISIENRF